MGTLLPVSITVFGLGTSSVSSKVAWWIWWVIFGVYPEVFVGFSLIRTDEGGNKGLVC